MNTLNHQELFFSNHIYDLPMASTFSFLCSWTIILQCLVAFACVGNVVLGVSVDEPWPSSLSNTVGKRMDKRTSSNEHRHHYRFLENNSGSGDQENEYNNNYYDDNENDGDNNGNVFSRVASRVWQDMADMWDTAPSSWVTEYWEVFTGIALLAFVLLLLHCCMVFDMCCNNENAHGRSHLAGGRAVMTKEEADAAAAQAEEARAGNFQLMEEQADNNNANNNNDDDEADTKNRRSPSENYVPPDVPTKNTQTNEKEGLMKIDKDAATAGDQQAQQSTTKKASIDWRQEWKRMQHLGKETFSVWTEFLGLQQPTNTYSYDDNDSNENHQQHQVLRTSRSSRSRLSKSPPHLLLQQERRLLRKRNAALQHHHHQQQQQQQIVAPSSSRSAVVTSRSATANNTNKNKEQRGLVKEHHQSDGNVSSDLSESV